MKLFGRFLGKVNRMKSAKTCRYLAALIGVCCAAGTVIAIPLGNSRLALVNFFYLALIFIGAYLSNYKIRVNGLKIILWSFVCYQLFLSIIVCLIFDSDVAKDAFVLVFKISILVIGISAWFSDKQLKIIVGQFNKYFVYGAFIQMVWSWLERLSYSIFYFKLNDYIFGEILSLESSHALSFIQNDAIRPSGLSWEPANLALTLVIGFILSEKKWQKILFATSIVLSTSTTGLVMLLSILMFDFLYNFRLSFAKIRNSIILGVALLIVGMIIDETSGTISYNIEKLSSLFDVTDSNMSTAFIHFLYYYYLLDVLQMQETMNLIFGSGSLLAGNVYSGAGIINYYLLGKWWNPESDFITILIGNGLIGVIIYYYFLIKLLVTKYIENKVAEFKIVFVILIGGFTYLFATFTWPFIIISILCYKDENNNRNNSAETY